MSKFFKMSAENFSEVQEELEQQLNQMGIQQKDILSSQLLVEEIFWRIVKRGKIEQVKIQVDKKFFGGASIQMTSEGNIYNPLVEVLDLSEDDENYYRMLILKANRKKLDWFYEQNLNVVTINVQNESNRQLKLTLAGMLGGIICGFLMKEFLSPETISVIDKDFITPINTMFLNALGMVIAPVIFFSIISGIIGMGAGAGVGRIGSKLIGLYLSTSVIAACIGLLVAWLFFRNGVPQVGEISAVADNVNTYEFSWIEFIVGIIPSNLVNPIINGNLMQVIFIAVLFGITLNNLGNRAKPIRELVSSFNEFFMKIVSMIIFFVPLIVFLAMSTLFFNMDTNTVLMMGKLIISQLLACGVLLVVYMLLIRLVGKISPLPFLKKIPALMAIPFATSSSAVTMPFTMNFCTNKLGISPKISSFSIPIGTTVNMNGGCIYNPLVVIMFLKMYGVDVNLNAIMIILAMTVSISVGVPAVPNAYVICLLSITSVFGVPNSIAGILFCLDTVCDRVVTCFNVMGDVAATMTLARTENATDEKIYFRE